MSVFFVYKSEFQCSNEKLFGFHESPEGFSTLVGADPNVKVLQKPNSLQVNEKAILQVQLAPGIKVVWEALHTGYEKNVFFEDTQIKGPFPFFKHRHNFYTVSEEISILEDKIEIDFPFLFVSKYFIFLKLKSQFKTRHDLTAKFLNTKRKDLDVSLKSS